MFFPYNTQYLLVRSLRRLRICVTTFSSPISVSMIEDLSRTIHRRIREKLPLIDDRGIVSSEDAAQELLRGCDIVVGFVGTGGTEHIMLSASKVAKGMILVYGRYYNSLPAVLEALPVLKKNIPVIPVSSTDIAALNRAIRIIRASIMVKSARFGVIGGPSPWLIYSRFDKSILKERLGTEIMYIDMDELINLMESIKPSSEDAGVAKQILSGAKESHVSYDDVLKACLLYKAIKHLVTKYDLDGVTIRCFDLIPKLGTTACLALSLLNKEGIPAACEGDVPSLIMMSMAMWALDTPPFMANVVWVEDDLVYLAHCTAPIAYGYSLYTHFETGKGVGIRVDYPCDSIASLSRIDNRLSCIRILVGRVVSASWSDKLCRTQVALKVKGARRVLDDSMGNHYIMIYGDDGSCLAELGRILGLRVEYIT